MSVDAAAQPRRTSATLFGDDEAEPLSQRALASFEKVLGSEHPNTAVTRNSPRRKDLT